MGEAELATKEKGKRALDEAAKHFSRLIVEFASLPKPPRGEHHDTPPTIPMPWGQGATKPTKKSDVHGEYVKTGGKKSGKK